MSVQVLNELLINWRFERCREIFSRGFRQCSFEACGEKLRVSMFIGRRRSLEAEEVYYITVRGFHEEIYWVVFEHGHCTLEVADWYYAQSRGELNMEEFFSSSVEITQEEADHMQVLYPHIWEKLPWLEAGLSKIGAPLKLSF